MVRNALYSIANSAYSNWHVAFYDDGSKEPGEPLAREIIEDRISFYKNPMSLTDKLACGHNIGENLNNIIKEHMNSYDAAIMLADDDALHPEYLSYLDRWYRRNSNSYYSYSFISPYDPMKETYFSAVRNFKPNIKDMAVTKLDFSQVSWRLDANKFLNIWFPERGLKGIDTKFFDKMKLTGDIWCTGEYGQFKGMHPKQLSRCDHRWSMHGEHLDCSHLPKPFSGS
jgi:hypothetical protein